MKEIHETLLARDTKPQDAQRAGRIATTTREIELFNYTKKRLAYLVPDEYHFQLIDRIQYRDYAGKFAVFYENVRKGRLFDFIESSTNGGRILFPEPFGEFSAESMSDLDKPLKETFLSRVRELSPLRPLERAALRA